MFSAFVLDYESVIKTIGRGDFSDQAFPAPATHSGDHIARCWNSVYLDMKPLTRSEANIRHKLLTDGFCMFQFLYDIIAVMNWLRKIFFLSKLAGLNAAIPH